MAKKQVSHRNRKDGDRSAYPKSVKQEILTEIQRGQSVLSIAKRVDMPCEATIYRWAIKDPKFAEQYLLARQIQAERMVDEILDLSKATVVKANKGDLTKIMLAAVSRHVENIKWAANHLYPQKYNTTFYVKQKDLEAISGEVVKKEIKAQLFDQEGELIDDIEYDTEKG